MKSPCLFVALCCCLSLPVLAAEIYKYKDEHGNWVFSDKKPATESAVETIPMAPEQPRQGTLDFRIVNRDGKQQLLVKNPFHAPIEFHLRWQDQAESEPAIQQVLEPQLETLVYQADEQVRRFRYRWVLGAPNPQVADYAYHLPVASAQAFTISQSFNGRFSHSREPSRYAVDVAMQVGTYIAAARPGTVIRVKDDYHMGGRADFQGTSDYFPGGLWLTALSEVKAASRRRAGCPVKGS